MPQACLKHLRDEDFLPLKVCLCLFLLPYILPLRAHIVLRIERSVIPREQRKTASSSLLATEQTTLSFTSRSLT